MPSAATVFTVIAGIVALIAGYLYVFGIPPQYKRAMEDKALETMGENKASYLMKGVHDCRLQTSFANMDGLQIKSARFQRLTREMSRSCRRDLEMLLVAHCRTLSERTLATSETA